MNLPTRLAVDIGGTFTDVVLWHDARLFTCKVLTTYADPANGVLEGVRQVLGDAAVAPDAISLVLHGTTLATNALIERRGARTALVTTEGHRDALEMALENRFEQYDVNVERPAALVPRALRFTVRERMDARGKVLLPLDEGSLSEVLQQVADSGADSVAVGLLHGYANPAHELRVAEALAQKLADLDISLASEVCPEVREYERLSTACANAYVRPLVSTYLRSLYAQLQQFGIDAPVLLMTSGGGLTTLSTASRYPIRLVESGPAGGAVLAAALARRNALAQVLSFDMGGTTAKICLIDDGEPQLSRSFEVDRVYRFKKGSGLPVRIPVIEMVEIGAGGGSIAAVDRLQRIAVGPESAGSEPGPAAYGRGGNRPTVSDADVVLGRLAPQHFAGGLLELDTEAAKTAVRDAVASPLDVSTEVAAHGIVETVEENMAAAARVHANEWGKDLRNRTLIAFGGAAPLHAARLADKLHIDRVLIPSDAGVGSALGFLLAPVSFEVVRSQYGLLQDVQTSMVVELLSDMRSEAAAVVASAAPDAVLTENARAYMRYVGQGFEISVPVTDLGEDLTTTLSLAFAREYEKLYGRTIPGLDIEILSWTLSLATPAVDFPEVQRVTTEVTPSASATLYDGQARVAARHVQRNAMRTDEWLTGPLLVLEAQTTTFVPAHFRVARDATGQLTLERSHE